VLRLGEPVHLTPKAFELLWALAAGRPRVLSKVELRQILWPDTHVLDANLPNLVAEVRDAIGDDTKSPRFVRTVHGFGYAFCGDAAELDGPRGPDSPRPFVYRLAWRDGLAALAEGEYILGRDAESVVPIDAKGVSRRHARLVIAEGRAVLEDLGSRNGTYVAGSRLSAPTVLDEGAEFRLGPLSFTFLVSRAESQSDTWDG